MNDLTAALRAVGFTVADGHTVATQSVHATQLAARRRVRRAETVGFVAVFGPAR